MTNRHEFRSCLSKVRYTKDNAKKTARVMRRKFGPDHKNIKAYHCEFCEWWHIGHKGQKKHEQWTIHDSAE